MAISNLSISYPDFELNETIDPDAFDINNNQIVTKINQVIDLFNRLTDSVAVGSSGSELVAARAIADVPGANVYEQLVSLRSQIQELVNEMIPAGSVTYAMLSDEVKEAFLNSSGDDSIPNNKFYRGKTTDGTSRIIGGVSTSNEVVLGDAANPLVTRGNSVFTYNGNKVYHSGNKPSILEATITMDDTEEDFNSLTWELFCERKAPLSPFTGTNTVLRRVVINTTIRVTFNSNSTGVNHYAELRVQVGSGSETVLGSWVQNGDVTQTYSVPYAIDTIEPVTFRVYCRSDTASGNNGNNQIVTLSIPNVKQYFIVE